MQSKTEILKLIKSIGTRGKKLDSDIQIAAVHSVFYSVCYGDVTIGQRLVEELNAGSRKAALVAFLENYGQFEYKGSTLVYRKSDAIIEFKDGDDIQAVSISAMLEDVETSELYAESIDKQWTDFKKEQISSKYDVLASVKALIKRAEKEIAAGNAANSAMFDYLTLALEEYNEAQEQAEGEEDMLKDGTNG